MYFVIVLGVLVFCSLCMSVCRFTVSNAFVMSSATVTVLCGGRLWLKPVAMWSIILWRAVSVECFALNPCWCAVMGRWSVKYGSSIFSSSLAVGDSREIGLYESPLCTSLLGLGMGTILASFHMCGIMFLFSDMLYVLVR